MKGQAAKSLKAKRKFLEHLATFIGVSILMIAIWALAGTDNFFRPIIPIAGWGVFRILPHWRTTYKSKGITEEKIQPEIKETKKQGGPGA